MFRGVTGMLPHLPAFLVLVHAANNIEIKEVKAWILHDTHPRDTLHVNGKSSALNGKSSALNGKSSALSAFRCELVSLYSKPIGEQMPERKYPGVNCYFI